MLQEPPASILDYLSILLVTKREPLPPPPAGEGGPSAHVVLFALVRFTSHHNPGGMCVWTGIAKQQLIQHAQSPRLPLSPPFLVYSFIRLCCFLLYVSDGVVCDVRSFCMFQDSVRILPVQCIPRQYPALTIAAYSEIMRATPGIE